MSDVFISYSRKDKDFVEALHTALKNCDRTTWVDWSNIPLTADWWKEIEAGIEAADTFVFVLSRDAVSSNVCRQEVEYAVQQHKRLVPIVRRDDFDGSQVHPALRKHNWLFFQECDDFEHAFQLLIQAINTDLEHVRQHTRLLVRAIEWDNKQRNDSFLLRGAELEEAEQWLARSVDKEPYPTDQQRNYVNKSREVEAANQRLTEAGHKAQQMVRLGSGVLALAVAVAAVVGVITQRNIARSHKIAQLEQSGVESLRQFQSQEIAGLLSAMQDGQELRDLVGDGDRPLGSYPALSPAWALQQILNQVQESNHIQAHNAHINRIRYNPDGRSIVTASEDGTARLWDLHGNRLAEFKEPIGEVSDVSFMADETLVTASDEGVIRVWTTDGDQLKTFGVSPKAIRRISLSPDGKTLAVIFWNDNVMRLWDMQGNLLREFKGHRGNLTSVKFSPDGRSLVTTSEDTTARLWSLQGKQLAVFEGGSYLVSASFSPDGKTLATGSAEEMTRLWDLKGNLIRSIEGFQGWVEEISFSPDGQRMAIASSGGIAGIWDLEGNLLYEFRGHQGSVEDISFSPNGHQVMTVALDNVVRIWNLEGHQLTTLRDPKDEILDATFSPDGQRLATASEDGKIRVWSSQGKELTTFQGHNGRLESVSFSPDGQRLAGSTFGGSVYLWDVQGHVLAKFGHTDRVMRVVFSPDGNWLATASYDNTARIWNVKTKQTMISVQHDSWVRDISFSPDGRYFVTGSEDGTARLWNLQGQQLVEFKGHVDGVNGVSFSPDGQRLATASDDSTIRLWNLRGQQLAMFQKHTGRVWDIGFSPDGQSFATASYDGTARLWDLQGNQTAEFKGHTGPVVGVHFSPDGRSIVTSAMDGIAKVWPVAKNLDDLLAQGCNWLQDYLIGHPDTLVGLEVCHTPDVLAKAAPFLVLEGEKLAKAGDIKGAIAKLRIALEWNAELNFNPTVRAQQFQLIGQGETLTKSGDVTGAIAKFQQALALDASLDLNPETTARQLAVSAFIEQGDALAQEGKAKDAIAKFQQARELDSSLPVDPTTRANRLAAQALVDQGKSLLLANKVDEAIALVNQAYKLDPTVQISPRIWADLCLQGSLNNLVAKVIDACDRAVDSELFFVSRRGLARTLLGDIKGAIADMQAYIDWSNRAEVRSQSGIAEARAKRQRWLDILRSGKNPFTPEELDRLRNGGF